MAPLVKELERREEIESIVCVTAQHREMLDQVLETFDITPDYDLNIMKQGQTLSEVTTRALLGLEEVIKEANENIIIIDNYIDKSILDMLVYKKENVSVELITSSHYLTKLDIEKFNSQYNLKIKYTNIDISPKTSSF